MHTLCLLGEEITLFFGLSTIPVYLHDEHNNYNLFLMYILLLWHNTITVRFITDCLPKYVRLFKSTEGEVKATEAFFWRLSVVNLISLLFLSRTKTSCMLILSRKKMQWNDVQYPMLPSIFVFWLCIEI